MQAQHNAAVRARANEWAKLLLLHEWHIELVFSNERLQQLNPDAFAVTEAQPTYRRARITFPQGVPISDDVILHELLHIRFADTQFACSQYEAEKIAELMARILLKVRALPPAAPVAAAH